LYDAHLPASLSITLLSFCLDLDVHYLGHCNRGALLKSGKMGKLGDFIIATFDNVAMEVFSVSQ
jgi:hypothetical protein